MEEVTGGAESSRKGSMEFVPASERSWSTVWGCCLGHKHNSDDSTAQLCNGEAPPTFSKVVGPHSSEACGELRVFSVAGPLQDFSSFQEGLGPGWGRMRIRVSMHTLWSQYT